MSRFKVTQSVLVWSLLVIMQATVSFAQATSSTAPQGRRAGRVFFQDDQTRSLKWADLYVGKGTTLGPVSEVKGFPKLDPSNQMLVQMESSESFLLVGVRDEEEGQFQSGWILIDSGVRKEEHGDHFHWQYNLEPKVRSVVLDKQQGNPAHVYCYEGVFYVANDKLGGCTRIDPKTITDTDTAETIAKKAAFHAGGSGHITLAAVKNKYIFATWIDRQGEHAGRVDVCNVSNNGSKSPIGSIKLPTGGLHGATACGNKAFFAPMDGICWVSVPTSNQWKVEDLSVQHISLGKDGDKPVRTGAFNVFDKYVCFTTGGGTTAKLNWIDSSASSPAVKSLTLSMHESNKPASLELINTRQHKAVGFVFHDHPQDADAPNKLTIVNLDVNNDGVWNDSKIIKELEVGKASVEGHGGHHSIGFSADKQTGVITNSGDGTATLLRLDTFEPVATVQLGGSPSKAIVVGGK